ASTASARRIRMVVDMAGSPSGEVVFRRETSTQAGPRDWRWSALQRRDLRLALPQAHAVEREVVLHRIARVELAQAPRDVEGHRPARRAIAGQADAARDRVDVRIERD